MSMKFVKSLFFGIAILLLFSILSCKKYLEKKSDDTIATPETLTDLQAILDNNNVLNLRVTPSFGEASSDNYFLPDATYSTRGPMLQDVYRWIPVEYEFNNDWATCYFPVYLSNLCLERLNGIEATNNNITQWNNIKGSALFFRAYYFQQLSWIFAKAYDEMSAQTDLGIVLRLGSDFNVPSVRANVKQSYDQIIQDAKESAHFLPDISQHVFRPSKASAYGLLARTYLSMRMYDSAYKYSNLCLGIKSVLLNYKNVTPTSNLTTPFLPYSYSQNSEIIFYTEMITTFAGSLISNSRARIDTNLVASYAGNDLRKKLFFNRSGAYYQFKGTYAPSLYFSGIAVDEIFLIRAECYARGWSGRTANKDSALYDLNYLLSNRYDASFSPVIATDANGALDSVLNERRKELLMRGLRWSDIKRLNKEERNIPLKRFIAGQYFILPPNDKRYALPLPIDIIRTTGIQQN
jgi:hypothetical protein